MKNKVRRKVNSYTKERIIDIVRKVCGSYATGEYTLESCCKNAGVPYRTYKDWWSRYEADSDNVKCRWYCLAEVAGLWEQAKLQHIRIHEEILIHKAESLLLKAVSGYEYEETIILYKQSFGLTGEEILTPTGFRKHKKYRPPSDKAIQFVLTKLKPEIYGNVDAAISIQLTPDFSRLSLDEIEQEIRKFELMLNIE